MPATGGTKEMLPGVLVPVLTGCSVEYTTVSFFTPSTAKGTLYLELSDPLLSKNPVYSIALANKDVFDQTTGLNKLFEIQ